MTAKMSPKFVVLSALAVGAIYATGYSVSAPGSTALAASGSTTGNVSGGNPGKASGSAASQANGSSQTGSQSGSQSGTQTVASHSSGGHSTSSSQTKTANTTQQYLDGTYSGSAANQIGAVAVNVTIQAGKIANVQITACYTHYPQSYIDPVLPDYVVAHQTTQIPVVSGATLSTEDFYYAVVQALQSAQNPNYKG